MTNDQELGQRVRDLAQQLCDAASGAANAGLEVSLEFEWMDAGSLDHPNRGRFVPKCTVRRVHATDLV